MASDCKELTNAAIIVFLLPAPTTATSGDLSQGLSPTMPAAPVYQDLENTLKTAHLIAPLFIWSIIGTLCCLPVLPRVWATRIFTLRFHVGAILFICVQAIINAWIWSGHARYIPILTQMCTYSYGPAVYC